MHNDTCRIVSYDHNIVTALVIRIEMDVDDRKVPLRVQLLQLIKRRVEPALEITYLNIVAVQVRK